MQLIVTLMLTAVLVACGSSAPPVKQSDRAVLEQDDALAIGDVFDIRVYGEEELSSSYRVGDDGSIQFPLIGSVEAAGLKPAALAELIAKRLEEDEYLKSPQVSIFVKETASRRINVVGAVNSPGSFQMTPGMTIVQAIGQAGGFSALADKNETVVSRNTQGTRRKFKVPVAKIAEGDAADVPLQAGDIVYIPERLF